MLSRRVQALRASLVDPAWASVNFLRLDNPPLQEVVEAAAMLPFGPGNKMILIDRCELFTKKKSKGGDDKPEPEGKAKDRDRLLDDFEKSLASVAPNTHLIFACPFNFDSTLKTSKAAKAAPLERIEKEKYYLGGRNGVLESWCRTEAKNHGVSIEDKAVTYLLDGTEANLRQIANEIEKAATYILPNKHITYDVVVRLSPYQSHVFALTDYWLNGKGKETLVSVDELLSRQNAMPIIATMQTFISRWILIKALADKFNRETPTGPGVNRRELPFPELVRRVAASLRQRSL